MFKDSQNTEEGLIRASLEAFIACWRSKQEADFSLQFREGKVRLNFSCSLGNPDKTHVDPSPRKRTRRKSLRQIARNNARAAGFSRAQKTLGDALPVLSQPPRIAASDREDSEEPASGNVRQRSDRNENSVRDWTENQDKTVPMSPEEIGQPVEPGQPVESGHPEEPGQPVERPRLLEQPTGNLSLESQLCRSRQPVEIPRQQLFPTSYNQPFAGMNMNPVGPHEPVLTTSQGQHQPFSEHSRSTTV